MKATLEFDLPEEAEDHQNAVNGTKYRACLEGLDTWLRNQIKHCDRKEFSAVRDQLHMQAEGQGVPLT